MERERREHCIWLFFEIFSFSGLIIAREDVGSRVIFWKKQSFLVSKKKTNPSRAKCLKEYPPNQA